MLLLVLPRTTGTRDGSVTFPELGVIRSLLSSDIPYRRLRADEQHKAHSQRGHRAGDYENLLKYRHT